MRCTVSAITARIDRAMRDRADQQLRFPLGRRSREQQRAEELVDAGVQFVGRHDVVQEPDPVRLGGGEALGGQEVATRRPRADRLDHVRRDGGGNQPELRLRQRERRVLRPDRDVAAGDQSDAAAERVAVDPGDRRLAEIGERREQRRQRRGIGEILGAAVARHPAHPVEVAPGAETESLAQQHDGADAVVGIDRAQQRGELGDQRVVERVVHLGSRQRHQRDALADVERDGRRRQRRGRRPALAAAGFAAAGRPAATRFFAAAASSPWCGFVAGAPRPPTVAGFALPPVAVLRVEGVVLRLVAMGLTSGTRRRSWVRGRGSAPPRLRGRARGACRRGR